jgi:hypothetical protein
MAAVVVVSRIENLEREREKNNNKTCQYATFTRLIACNVVHGEDPESADRCMRNKYRWPMESAITRTVEGVIRLTAHRAFAMNMLCACMFKSCKRRV